MDEAILTIILKKYEDKLKTYMTAEEYGKFATATAKEAFYETVQGMEDGDFKQFVLSHFDEIVDATDKEYNEWKENDT